MSLSPSVRPLHVPQINLDMYTSKRPIGLTRKEEFTKRLADAELNIELWADNIQAIKDKELWREGGYDSFKEFCEKALHKSRKTVYQLLSAGEIASEVNSKKVSAIADTPSENPNESIPKISKEAQARALKSVPKEQRLEVLKKATEGNGKVTARAITEAAEELLDPVAKAKGKPESRVLENGETLDDYKRHNRPATQSGKPKKCMAVWRDLQQLYGKALNRLDEANRIAPNKGRHDDLIKRTKALMKEVEVWQEEA